jgi:hypothetical protein
MSQATTLILLPETSYNSGNTPSNVYTVTGTYQPAAAYYLGNRDLQTVNLKLTNVTGNIVLEASLATTPTEQDWFEVGKYVANSSNTTTYTNIEGNFVYMRAKVEDFAQGTVQYVKLSY